MPGYGAERDPIRSAARRDRDKRSIGDFMIGLDNPLHIALLLFILLLIFGAKRLPEMGRSLGSGLRGFKESISGESHEPVAELSSVAAEPSAAPPATGVGARAESTSAQPSGDPTRT
jgi:sec-independent protein translocase protein TatA